MFTQLILLSAVLVLAGLYFRFGIMLPYLRDRMVEASSDRQSTIAQYVAREIDGKVQARTSFLDRLSARLPPALLTDPRGLDAWLETHQRINPIFSGGLMVIPPDGRGLIGLYPELPGRRDLDFGASDYFVRALAERRTVIGKPIRGRVSGEPMIVMASPVRDDAGETLAVLAGVTALGAPGFLDLLQQTTLGDTGGFLIVSPRDGLFVAGHGALEALSPLPKPGLCSLHDRAVAGFRGVGIDVDPDGVERLSAIASIPAADWFLVATVPTSEALETVDEVRGFVLRGVATTAALVFCYLAVVVRRWFTPLATTSRLIHRMAAGEIELQPVPVVRKDEVGELAIGFNFLLARLNEITGQKLAAERLRAEEQARMEVSLRQWMADTSHELRTPIAVLRAQIEAFQDGVNPVDARTLGILHGEVMGLSRLVDDLHVLARSDVGHLDCRLDPMAPLDLLEDVVDVFRERLATAGLAVEWAERPEAEPIIAGDPGRLRQVFSNLIENSRRYTDPGGRLRLGGRIEGDRLAIRFEDSAPGVPPNDLPHLFERFFRVDGSRSRVGGGSGIGLAVSESIVTAHGGTIEAAPSALGGLCIDVFLPVLEGRA